MNNTSKLHCIIFFGLSRRLLRPGALLLTFLIAAILTPAAHCLAQTDPLTAAFEGFDNYRNTIPQEKIFVHTDKPFYLAGEILWCRLYYIEGDAHTPMTLSKIAYIELLNKDDKPVLQGKIGLEKGAGHGSFYLPPSLSSGTYRLRAYTAWMKNTGPESFFEQPLTIVNSFKGLPSISPADSQLNQHTGKSAGAAPARMDSTLTSAPVHMGLFPEGGNLVNGIRSKIAFEVTDALGKAAEARGWVVDERMDTLTTFQPGQDGLGSFWLTPRAGHTYTARWLFPDGRSGARELPAAFDRGYTLRVEEGENQRLAVTIGARAGLSLGSCYLFVRTGLAANITERINLAGDSTIFLLDKSRLGEGVNQLTLFDGAGQPVCQRLYCIAPHHRLTIGAGTDQGEYGVRKKVSLSLSTTEEDGKQTSSGLSMAVYRVDSLQPSLPADIYTWLWLGSELRGWIGSPEALEGQGKEAAEALDNLMLTHGWRRYRWEDILQRQADATLFPPEPRGQLITGRLTDIRTGQPGRNITLYLSVPGIRYQLSAARTDAEGKFLFDIKDFYGSTGIVIQTNTPKDSVYKVEIFSPWSERYARTPLPVFSVMGTREKLLLQRSIGMQVQNIYMGDSLKKFSPPFVDSLRFYGRPDYTYQLDDYTRFITMEEVLREYVREINVNHENGHLHVLMLNEPIRQFFEDDNTLVLLDGVPVPDDRIFSYDPLKVKTLEVIPREYVMGPITFSGIASFTTYKGDYEGLEMDARSLLIDYDGLQLQREFYAPVYETPQQTASRLPDFRNLLFWSPDIHTDAQGKKELSFYTSDLPGKYLVVVQGLTTDGRAGVKYLRFEVK